MRIEPPRQAVEIGDGVYAYVQPDGTWWINNTGFVVGHANVLSVDACATVSRTRAYLESIREHTDRPVSTLLNTHHHGDHTFGNFLFKDATVIGHERVRPAMAAWGEPRSAPFWEEVEWGDVELRPPSVTFAESLTVHVDDLACEMHHVGTPAHTDNDSVVWLPQRGVLFSGDLLFNGGTPFMAQGSIAGMLVALDVVESFGAEVIVPGHGPVCGPEVIDQVRGYVRFVQDTAFAGVDAGLTPLEAARECDLGQYAELLDAERLVANLHRGYAEVTGDTPLDLTAAFMDMVEINGGPLTSHA